MTTLYCPICKTSIPSHEVPTFPFCSTRCKQIDLKRWLGEEYRLPEPDIGQGDEADLPYDDE